MDEVSIPLEVPAPSRADPWAMATNGNRLAAVPTVRRATTHEQFMRVRK